MVRAGYGVRGRGKTTVGGRRDEVESVEGKGEEGDREREGGVVFWNVARLRGKDREFWRSLGKWEVVILMETWLEEKGWEKWKNWLPKGFKWGVQHARRKNRKGRAIGGMLMEIEKKLVERGKEIEVGEEV